MSMITAAIAELKQQRTALDEAIVCLERAEIILVTPAQMQQAAGAARAIVPDMNGGRRIEFKQ